MTIFYEQIFSPHGFLMSSLQTIQKNIPNLETLLSEVFPLEYNNDSLYSASFTAWDYAIELTTTASVLASSAIQTQKFQCENLSIFFDKLVFLAFKIINSHLNISTINDLNLLCAEELNHESLVIKDYIIYCLYYATQFVKIAHYSGGHQAIQTFNQWIQTDSVFQNAFGYPTTEVLNYHEIKEHPIVLHHFKRFLEGYFTEHKILPLFVIQKQDRLFLALPNHVQTNHCMNQFEEFYVYTQRPVLVRNAKNGDIILRHVYNLEQLIEVAVSTLKGVTIHIDDWQTVKRIFSGWYSYQTYVKMEHSPSTSRKIFPIVFFDKEHKPTRPKYDLYINALSTVVALRGEFDRFKNLKFQKKVDRLKEFVGYYFDDFIHETKLDISALKKETQQAIYAVILSSYADFHKIQIEDALAFILKDAYPTYPNYFKEAYDLFKNLRNQWTRSEMLNTKINYDNSDYHNCILCEAPATIKMESHFFPITNYVRTFMPITDENSKVKQSTYICTQCLMHEWLILDYAESLNVMDQLKKPPEVDIVYQRYSFNHGKFNQPIRFNYKN